MLLEHKFKQYHSVENSTRQDYIDLIIANNLQHGEFVVQEKVHGANLTFITDGKEIQCAKRTDLLKSGEKFFNYERVRDRYREKIFETFKLVQKIEPEMDILYIFGELFGGNYPHPDVAKVPEAMKLQQGVYYSPDNDFYAFDLRVYNKSYLDLDQCAEIFEKVGFLYAKTLFRGTFEECLKYPNEFQSNIAKWLGLPEIENNIAEGIVIKPVELQFLPTKDRVIIKNKNPKYEEKIIRKKKIKRPRPKLSKQAENLQEEVSAYINENRLNNVLSKVGEIDWVKLQGDKVQMGKIAGLFAQDALKDFQKDFSREFEALEKTDQKNIKTFVSKECVKFVKSVQMPV